MGDERVTRGVFPQDVEGIIQQTSFAEQRDKFRAKYLGEVGWRLPGVLKDLAFSALSPTQEQDFLSLGTESFQPFTVANSWVAERPLLGDYAVRVVGHHGPVGYVSFSMLSNGDAFIMQVQGQKGKHFVPHRRQEAVNLCLDFLQNNGVERVFLMTGEIRAAALQEQSRTPELVERLGGVYEAVAKDHHFDQTLYGLPYKVLSKTTE